MNAIDYVVRTRAGSVQRDAVTAQSDPVLVQALPGSETSFNLSKSDMRGYTRVDQDLHIELADGRVIVLQGYFAESGEKPRLFLSTDGVLDEVFFAEGDSGVLFAEYGRTAEWGKWTPDDALIYYDRPEVASVETYGTGENDVSMLAAGLLGGSSLFGVGAAGAAAAVGAAALLGDGDDGSGGGSGDGSGDGDTGGGDTGGGDSGGGDTGGGDTGGGDTGGGDTGGGDTGGGDTGGGDTGGGDAGGGDTGGGDTGGGDTGGGDTGGGDPTWVEPTVDDTAVVVGGDGATEVVTVTGTGDPGAEVSVVIGGITVVNEIDENGDWSVVFDGPNFPADGDYVAEVTVSEGTNSETLTGPSILIDLTGPVIAVTDGTADVGDLVNLAGHPNGVTVTGTGEAGAAISVTIDGATHDTTVDGDGNWSVDFTSTEIATGEYSADVTIVSTDIHGNTSTLMQTLTVDTIPNDITINTGAIGGNGVVNGMEAAGDLAISGTATAGATIEVTVAGITQTVTADAAGDWSFTLPADSFADGAYDAPITAVSTDAAGNTSSTSGTVQIDTENTVSINDTTVETDGVINEEERADGVDVTGTAEPGSTVEVEMNGVTETTVAGPGGNWTVTYDPEDVPTGEVDVPVTVTATDPAGNSSTATGTLQIDTETSVTLNEGAIAGDGVVNAVERDAGVEVTGTAEAGATVDVVIAGATQSAVTDASGNWTVTFDAGDVPTGEQTVPISVTSTDPAGNTATTSGSVEIDTETSVAINEGAIGGDGLVNAAEHAGGVEITGTAQPGATVEVVIAGVTESALTDASGNWTVTFDSADVPTGTLNVPVSVTATDVAGNTATASGSFDVDTETAVTLDDAIIAGDGVISAAERDAGVDVTGTAEAGATVDVTIAGATQSAVADASGNWTVTFDTAQIPTGEQTVPVSVTSTGPAGNTATTTGSVEIDTETSVTINEGAIGGDGTVNAAEHAAGVAITGTAQPGATVDVVMAGVTQGAVADASGNWTVTFAPADVPTGTQSLPISVTATDAAGNSASTTGTVEIDTETSVAINEGAIGGDGLVNAAEHAGGVEITGTGEPGSTVEVVIAGVTESALTDASGNWTVTFASADVPTGTLTVPVSVTATDVAGNNATATGSFDVDTETAVTLDDAIIAGDGVISAAERDAGVDVTGTAEAGATVDVTIAGATQSAVADASGNWTVTFDTAQIPTGEQTVPVSVTSTGPAGNTATTTGSVKIDTETSVTINEGAIGGDGTVNAAEHAAGVAITGTAQPGATVDVVMAGVTQGAVADAAGNWTVSFNASDVPTGTQNVPVTATATDGAGNTATTNGSFDVDTETAVTLDDASIASDGVINAVERTNGVDVSGTAEPGASVSVLMNGITQTATAGANGAWTVTYAASDLPEGELNVPVRVTSTDAAGNSASTTGAVTVDTAVNALSLGVTPGGADGVVNAQEVSQGLSLTGQVEPGSTLVVSLNGTSHAATVDATGAWSVFFMPGELPAGEVSVPLALAATDPAGNTRTETQNVTFDTVAGTLALSTNPIEGDDVINDREASDGVVIHGTSDPGAVVTVTLEGVTHTTVTDINGNWTTTYTGSEIAPGTYTADITAQITDPAGNTLSVSDTVHVDTEVDNFANLTVSAGADDLINNDEANQGVTITGTTEPGATVMVTIEGETRPAAVDANGNWSAFFEGGAIPGGEYASMVHVESTDAAGNVAELSEPVRVDTFVNTLNVGGTSAGADGIVSAQELQAGGVLMLSGQVEPGSSVVLNFNGTAYTATVGGSGAWSVNIPAADVAPGEYDANFVISATDAAGNTLETTETLRIDTLAPEGPIVESITQDTSGIRGISTQLVADPQDVLEVSEFGNISDVAMTSFDVQAIGETNYFFSGTVPDGSDLIVSTADGAGNTRSTYLVLDDEVAGTEVSLDNPSLGAHNVEIVDLEFAEEAHLTLTEADILALSQSSDTLAVYGGVDDQVTLTGATQVGTVTNPSGQTFVEYQLGSATVLIDDDITNVVI
ncbi:MULTISPECIES: Ig-like domain-containing protein [unclassified Marinovum]